ncbi:dihydrodipicolinate synthase [Robbsia andropogonis]|uniref:Dihydrodipicolinate synthase n=1 Tax=Robbsia andropogonis TaxID=28092 RepID=A0A0F5K5W0_9BURK|nr:dihydrodipicolinate synthase family protein [Robbsia andropogonis]KKB65330.1 dihydrodipicolinate synthase [Robbsia andropogonis]
MRTDAFLPEELGATVMAVPPLARRADFSLDPVQNRRLMAHIAQGGVRTLLYGGNANLYHVPISEYGTLLDMLAEQSDAGMRVIPAIGADYGKMRDQARMLRERDYRTAMVLPMAGFTTPSGVYDGLSHIAELAGFPLTLYIKHEAYLDLDTLARLVEQGVLAAVKYAIVREQPENDPYLRALIDRLAGSACLEKLVSGMGERPAITHVNAYGLAAWTTGSGCIAPRAVMRLFDAVKANRLDEAYALHARFMPLETLRDRISLIRVLHDAVTVSGIADMGPMLPLLSNTDAADMPAVREATRTLLEFEQSLT